MGLSLSFIIADCCQLSKLAISVNLGKVNGLAADMWAKSDGSGVLWNAGAWGGFDGMYTGIWGGIWGGN